MTKDNYLAFREFEPKFKSALHSGYARFSAPELERFSQTLSSHRGTPLTRQERTCPHCLLVTLKKVADEYYKYEQSPRGKALLKQEQEEQTEQEVEDNAENIEDEFSGGEE